jgi:hypothetical protein
MSELVQAPMNRSNFAMRVKQYVQKQKTMKDNPVVVATRLPGDLGKMYQEAQKAGRR